MTGEGPISWTERSSDLTHITSFYECFLYAYLNSQRFRKVPKNESHLKTESCQIAASIAKENIQLPFKTAENWPLFVNCWNTVNWEL